MSDERRSVVELLRKIERGEGRYSQDRLTHAQNVIEDMQEYAREALALLVPASEADTLDLPLAQERG